MYDLERTMMVAEVKGLLQGLEKYIHRVRFNLASDNLTDLTEETKYIHEYINKMEEKINEYKTQENVDDDEWI